MPDLPISGLTEDTTPATTDTVPLRRASANFRATMAQLLGAFFGANQIIKADSANTVTALTMGASTILARLAAGGIVAATPTEVRTLLGIADSSTDKPAYRVVAAQEPVWGNNITLATGLENGDSLSGVTLATGDVVLLTAQSTGSQNGPWVVAASGAPSRPSWFPNGGDPYGFRFYCDEGYFVGRTFTVQNVPGGTIDTTALTVHMSNKAHRNKNAAPTSSNDGSQGYFPGDTWLWEDSGGDSRAWVMMGLDGGSPTWREFGYRPTVQLGTSTFSIGPTHAGRVCQWTGTSTGVAGTVDQGTPGQVTTLVLTGTAGTITFAAGSGVTLEAARGKTLTTQAPAATTTVTVSIIYLSATFATVTGDLA